MVYHTAHANLTRLGWALALTLVLSTSGLSLTACKSKTFDNPEYLSERLQAGDELAFRHVRRLEDPEARVAAIPALIDAFNASVEEDEVIRILLDIGHADAMPAFLSALESDDNRLAGLAARGIGTVGGADDVAAVANRLRRVRDPNAYEPFLDALRDLPGRPEVAPVLAEILSRPAGRIGGIRTVRYGCEILGKSGNTDRSTIDVLLFSLVNFIPQPFEDARLECQLALLQLGEPAVVPLLEMFLQQNQTVNDHLRSIRYEPVVGSLRAGWALSDAQADSVEDEMIAWFNTEQDIDSGYLSGLSVVDQQTWFANYGQMFEQAASYLGWIGEPTEEDPVHLLLRSMMARGEGSPLENFSDFLNTSDGAELGLRAAVLRALTTIGDPTDRDAILELAVAGSLARGRDAWIRQEAAHAFALLSQAGDMARFQELVNGIDETALREEVETYRPMVAIAEECQHQIDCLVGYLGSDDIWVREKASHDLSHYAENETQAAGALLAQVAENPALDARMMYARALRHLPLPRTGAEEIEAALEAASGTGPVFNDLRHEIRVLRELKLNE